MNDYIKKLVSEELQKNQKKELIEEIKTDKNIIEEKGPKYFNTILVDKIVNVDLYSGDYKTGTLANQEVFLLSGGKHFWLLLKPIPDDKSLKKGTILAFEESGDKKIEKSTWIIKAKLKDISQLFKYSKKPEIKLVIPEENINILPNDVVQDLYNAAMKSKQFYGKKHHVQFDKEAEETFGKDIMNQIPSSERNKKIKNFIEKWKKYMNQTVIHYYNEYLK